MSFTKLLIKRDWHTFRRCALRKLPDQKGQGHSVPNLSVVNWKKEKFNTYISKSTYTNHDRLKNIQKTKHWAKFFPSFCRNLPDWQSKQFRWNSRIGLACITSFTWVPFSTGKDIKALCWKTWDQVLFLTLDSLCQLIDRKKLLHLDYYPGEIRMKDFKQMSRSARASHAHQKTKPWNQKENYFL